MMNPLVELLKTKGMGSNSICEKCRKESGIFTDALGPWLVADPSHAPTILFVGKVAWGEEIGDEIAPYLEDCLDFGNKCIRTKTTAYWSYTRAIVERWCGDLEDGLKRVSFTNIVKCNNETIQDTTSGSARNYCINENGFIWEEIEFLRPRYVVFFTGSHYDDEIDEYMPKFATSWRNNADENEIAVGDKTMPWWDRSFLDQTGVEVLRFLRVGHPQCKAKDEFVDLVSRWLRNPPPSSGQRFDAKGVPVG